MAEYEKITVIILDKEGGAPTRTTEMSNSQYEDMLREYDSSVFPFLRFEGEYYRSTDARTKDGVNEFVITLVPSSKFLQ